MDPVLRRTLIASSRRAAASPLILATDQPPALRGAVETGQVAPLGCPTDAGRQAGGSLPGVRRSCLSAARYPTGKEPVAITAQVNQPMDDPRFREIANVCAFTRHFWSGVIANCGKATATTKAGGCA